MWDNSARRPETSVQFAYSNPYLYEKWLTRICETAVADPNNPENLVFVNAWNEWAEGTHLEPDRRYGFAYLEATAKAIKGARPLDTVPVSRIDRERILHEDNLAVDMGWIGGSNESLVQGFPDLEELRQLREELANKPAGWRAVTLIGDPVARNVNAFLATCNQFIPKLDARVAEDDVTADELHQVLIHIFDSSIPGRWFDDVFKPLFGVDVFATPFNPDEGEIALRCGEGEVRVVRRIESKGGGSGELEKVFFSKALPVSYLSAMYSTKYASHFFTRSELRALHRQWRGD